MSLNSFYGGNKGIDMTIKASFSSVEEMTAAFKRGPAFTDVWYGELCMIATKNLEHIDNGKLFVRGMNYTVANGDARFIGQIRGPKSGTPLMAAGTIEEVRRHSLEDIGPEDVRRYPIGYKTDEAGHVIGFELNTDENEPIATFPFSTGRDVSLVPGKEDDGTFNDEILYTWCNIKKPGSENDSWYYVGLRLVYPVTDFTTHMVDQYDDNGNIILDSTNAERTDDKSHPYYAMWNLALPKGIKGDSLRNMRVITPSATDVIYDPSAITIKANGAAKVGNPGYAGQEDDVKNMRQILVMDYYIFDEQRSPKPIMVYLGDYNMIDSIKVDDDGTVTIDYSHDDNYVLSRKLKWVNDITLSPDSGEFRVVYNNGDPAFETTLDWIRSIQLDADGTIHFIHTKDGRDESYNHLIKWVTDVTLNAATGDFVMSFNDGSSLRKSLDWVDDVKIDETTGRIVLHHTAKGDVVSDARLRLMKSASVDSTGIITIETNTGESFNLKQKGSETDYHLKAITDITLGSALADDKHIQVKYNTETTATPIGAPINYVHDMVVRSEDFHLLVLFNDPTHRAKAADLDQYGKDKNGVTWVDGVRGSDGNTTAAGIYWRDYGTIKDQSGVLIGMNITGADTGEASDVKAWLNEKYPNGITSGAAAQKVVVYTPTGSTISEFYAYDYNKNTWFFLGTLADDGMRDIALVEGIQPDPTTYDMVNNKGLVFKRVKATGLKTDAVPRFWDYAYTGLNA